MLQETTHERKNVGSLGRGYWYIKTARAVWDRVLIISRNRHYVRILYTGVKRYRVRHRNGYTFWKTRSMKFVEDLPIRWIVEARIYDQR